LHVGLTRLGMLTLRFGFPYAAQGRKRPDPPALLERTFRAAASALLTEPQAAPARVFLGGIGLGAQVAARVLAQGHVADGLLCLAYPLHPSGKPNQARAEALYRIICPMLFVQGSRDPYCRIDRLEAVLRRVGAPTVLHAVEDADHGLAPIKRSQRELDEVRAEILSTVESFVRKALGG
ncbi:MAG: alpha/beta family hydrolase, partial [Myxococcota bacterium]